MNDEVFIDGKEKFFTKKTPLMAILTVGDVFCKFFWLKTLQQLAYSYWEFSLRNNCKSLSFDHATAVAWPKHVGMCSTHAGHGRCPCRPGPEAQVTQLGHDPSYAHVSGLAQHSSAKLIQSTCPGRAGPGMPVGCLAHLPTLISLLAIDVNNQKSRFFTLLPS